MFFREIFSVHKSKKILEFEKHVKDETTNFINCYINSPKVMIEQTAQVILDARAKYSDCSLADLMSP